MSIYEGLGQVERQRFVAGNNYPVLILESVRFDHPPRTVVQVCEQKSDIAYVQRWLGSATFTANLYFVSLWPDARLIAALDLDTNRNPNGIIEPGQVCARLAKAWAISRKMSRA